MSNEELFKQALVEGVSRHFDKAIEQAKKNEQIEEMAKIVLQEPHIGGLYGFDERIASRLYNAGYRKQSVGEWIDMKYYIHNKRIYKCSECSKSEAKDTLTSAKYCPNCGAKMKGDVQK